MKLYRKISLFVVAVVIYSFAATNDSTIDSAVLKRIYMGNYSYNTCLSSQPILSMRWASDLNRPVFKNRTGTLYKSLMDASTTSNTPQYRVFFADANGLASSSSVFTYTSGALFAPWVKGDSIYTTGKISGATLNTGNGDNELYPMNQGVRTTDDVTFDSTSSVVINTTRSRTGLLTVTKDSSSANILINNGAKPNYIEFYATGHNERGSVGALGNFEMNLSYNMDYRTGVHKFYNKDQNANWLALNETGLYGQYTASGTDTTGDMWNNGGSLYSFHISQLGSFKINKVGIGDQPKSGNDASTVVNPLELTNKLNGYGFTYWRGDSTKLAATEYKDGSSYLGIVGFERANGTGITSAGAGYRNAYIIRTEGAKVGFSNRGNITSVIDTNGYIGINTIPQYPLHVIGDIYTSTKVLADTVRSTSGNSRLVLKDDNYIDLNTSQVNVNGNLTVTEKIVTDSTRQLVNYVKFASYVDSGGYHTGPVNRSWTVTGHAVNSATGKNQLHITNPTGNTAPLRIDSLSYDSTLVIASDTVKTKKLSIGGKRGAGCLNGSFNLTLSGFTTTVEPAWFYDAVDSIVTISTNTFTQATSNSSELYALEAIPSEIRPSADIYCIGGTRYIDSSTIYYGSLVVKVETDGDVRIYPPIDGDWSSTGSKGYYKFCFTYTKR